MNIFVKKYMYLFAVQENIIIFARVVEPLKINSRKARLSQPPCGLIFKI